MMYIMVNLLSQLFYDILQRFWLILILLCFDKPVALYVAYVPFEYKTDAIYACATIRGICYDWLLFLLLMGPERYMSWPLSLVSHDPSMRSGVALAEAPDKNCAVRATGQ